MQARYILMALAVALLWGGNFVAVKVATEVFPPIFLVALRFLFVAIVMVPAVGWLPKRALWPVLAVSFTLGGLHFALMFTGVSMVDASTASIAAQLGVPFSTLLAMVFFGDRLGWRRAVGTLTAFAGVAIVAGAPQIAGAWTGLLIVVAGAFAWAVGNSVIKYFGPLDPYLLTGWMAVFAVPQLLVASFALEQGQVESLMTAGVAAWLGLLYIVVGASLIAYTFWYSLINNNPVSHVVPFTLLAPVFAVVLAVLLLDEPLSWPLVLGGALTIAGVALCEMNFRRVRFWSRRRPDVAVAPD